MFFKKKPELSPAEDTELATEDNFSEVAYLIANLDVARAVLSGQFDSGFEHFLKNGQSEKRRQAKAPISDKDKDAKSLPSSVPRSDQASHRKITKLAAELGSEPGKVVLEVGSRKVTGAQSFRDQVNVAGGRYIGFDIYSGENVDVTGDAHKLSSVIGEQVDVIYSSAVFEHLAMPWVVATEIAKTLKVGGHLLVETHFSYSSHERPWHFFQFSDMALRCLFSPALGFECIEAGMCNPMIGRFSSHADQYLKRRRINGLFCHSSIHAKKVRDVPDFDWTNLDIQELVQGTHYPKPKN